MKKETIGSLFELFKLSLKKMCTVRVLLPLALFTLITGNIIPYISTVAVETVMPFIKGDEPSIASMVRMGCFAILTFVILIIYASFVLLIQLTASAYFVSTEEHRIKTDAKNIWSLIKKKWTKITLTTLLLMLIFLLAIGISALLSFISPYLAFAVGFIVLSYLLIRFYVAGYPAIFDGFGARKSLETSTKIMDGIKGKVAVFIVLLTLAYILISFAVFLPIGGIIHFFASPEYVSFLRDRPISEDFMTSITILDYAFKESLHFVGSFIEEFVILVSSGMSALLYLKRRELAVSTD